MYYPPLKGGNVALYLNKRREREKKTPQDLEEVLWFEMKKERKRPSNEEEMGKGGVEELMGIAMVDLGF